jgi:Holliday junction resolvase YEN1
MGLPQCVGCLYDILTLLTPDRLFEVIKDYNKSVLIAQLAEEPHRQNGRPLRVAIDEADWRFNNLTQAQVYAILDSR